MARSNRRTPLPLLRKILKDQLTIFINFDEEDEVVESQ